MSTSGRQDENVVICGANRDAGERLHRWLHQIAESDERDPASVLVDALIDAFGQDFLGTLLASVRQRAEGFAPKED